jgi:hypothetical protein
MLLVIVSRSEWEVGVEDIGKLEKQLAGDRVANKDDVL